MWHLSRHAHVIALGRTVRGYCSSVAPPAEDATEARRVLVATWKGSETEFNSTLLHEVAHHFLDPGPPLTRPPLRPEAVREARTAHQTMVRLGAEWDLLHVVVDPAIEREVRAARLARSWGAEGAAADECAQARATRHRFAREVLYAQLAIMD